MNKVKTIFIILIICMIKSKAYGQTYNVYMHLSSDGSAKFEDANINTPSNNLFINNIAKFPAILPIKRNDKLTMQLCYSVAGVYNYFNYTFTFNGTIFEESTDFYASGNGFSGSINLQILISPPSPTLFGIQSLQCYNQPIEIEGPNWSDYNHILEYTCNGVKDSMYIGIVENPSDGVIMFYPNMIGSISNKTTVYLRVRSWVTNDEFPDPHSPYSNTIMVDVLPPPPVLSLTNKESSCPSYNNTGKATLSILSSPVNTNLYTYRITSLEEDLVDINADTIEWGGMPVPFTYLAPFTIDSIKPGWHKMYVTYQNTTLNNCFANPVDTFFIGTFADLVKTNIAIGATCPGDSNGKLDVAITQGAGNYKMELYKNSALYQTYSNVTTHSFEGLASKYNYELRVYDKCVTTPTPFIFPISEPKGVSFSNISTSAPNCLSPANGGWQLSASGGEGNVYDYYIYKGNSLHTDSLIGTIDGINSDTSWRKFPSGKYLINLRDHSLPNCIGDNITSIIPVFTNPLTNSYSIGKVKCQGELNGSIAPSGSGGMGNGYIYSLHDAKQSYAIDNNLFGNLGAGNYTLTVRNSDNTCSDSAYINIDLGINSSLSLKLDTIKDIQCYGYANGRIAATVNPVYASWNWQMKNAQGEWKDSYLSRGSKTISEPGDYRLVVSDVNCTLKDSAVIREPDSLKLTSIFRNTRCINEPGHFELSSLGGNNNHSFQFSKNNGSWTNYTPGAPLSDASYTIRVIDEKGCIDENPNEFILSSPTDTLSFTYALSDYNGHNISCFGNNNGWVSTTVTGGNGGLFSGYTFALNSFTQSSALFDSLYAGPYTLSVTDGRGCRVDSSFSLTQPVSKLFLNVARIKPVKCSSDANGEVELAATGNDSPFTYSADQGPFGASNLFANLPKGKFRFEVKDSKGCTQSLDTSLNSLVPEMVVTANAYPVRCKGEASGFINAKVTGGGGYIAYDWLNTSSTRPDVYNLAKGNYTLKLTDSAGCIKTQTFEVTEPEFALAQDVYTKPVCAGEFKGLIQTKGQGGYPPYRYALNSPYSFNALNQFDVNAGKHVIFTSDVNNCTVSDTVVIETRNEKPDINFMVATSRYESDTLVIKDVSMPKPDSIVWVFPTGAKVIDNVASAPQVKFENNGKYMVTMKGWFSGCDYVLAKNIWVAPIDSLILPTDRNKTGIESLVIKPNPNNGNFSVQFKLYSNERVNIKVIDMYSKIVYQANLPTTLGYEHSIAITNPIPGTYLLVLTCETGNKSVRFIITN